MSKAGSIQRAILKDSYTYDMAALTVPWKSFVFFLVPNWFCCTDDEKKESRTVFYYCGSLSKNLSLTLEWMRKVNHRLQFPDCLVEVDLKIILVVSKMPLAKIFRR